MLHHSNMIAAAPTASTHRQPRQVFPMRNSGFVVDHVDKLSIAAWSPPDKNGPPCAPRGADAVVSTMIAPPVLRNSRIIELSKLSMEERTRGMHELHGVAEFRDEETPEMMQVKLNEVSRLADSFGENDRTSAYRKALTMDKEDYVKKIKILCLRADYYDSEKTAARLVSFFSFKLDLFGDSLLTRDIKMEDFNAEDREGLNKGICQLLQEKDQAGRAIVRGNGSVSSKHKVPTVCRALYYMMMSAIQDEEIQKKGVVLVYDLMSQDQFHSDRPSKFAEVLWLLPVRLVALHVCYSNAVLDFAFKMMANSMEGHYLCRSRSHYYDSHVECLDSLMTFGIPKDFWSASTLSSGELDLTFHHQWLENLDRKKISRAIASSTTTSSTHKKKLEHTQCSGDKLASVLDKFVPDPMDIVMGRGRFSKNSTGHSQLFSLVQERQEEYDAARKRAEKAAIVNSIIQELRSIGCRFVRSSPHGLEEVPEPVIREKISHAFRNARLKNVQKKRRQEKKAILDSVVLAMSSEEDNFEPFLTNASCLY